MCVCVCMWMTWDDGRVGQGEIPSANLTAFPLLQPHTLPSLLHPSKQALKASPPLFNPSLSTPTGPHRPRHPSHHITSQPPLPSRPFTNHYPATNHPSIPLRHKPKINPIPPHPSSTFIRNPKKKKKTLKKISNAHPSSPTYDLLVILTFVPTVITQITPN